MAAAKLVVVCRLVVKQKCCATLAALLLPCCGDDYCNNGVQFNIEVQGISVVLPLALALARWQHQWLLLVLAVHTLFGTAWYAIPFVYDT